MFLTELLFLRYNPELTPKQLELLTCTTTPFMITLVHMKHVSKVQKKISYLKIMLTHWSAGKKNMVKVNNEQRLSTNLKSGQYNLMRPSKSSWTSFQKFGSMQI